MNNRVAGFSKRFYYSKHLTSQNNNIKKQLNYSTLQIKGMLNPTLPHNSYKKTTNTLHGMAGSLMALLESQVNETVIAYLTPDDTRSTK